MGGSCDTEAQYWVTAQEVVEDYGAACSVQYR